jgi:hypothetical protein
MDDFTLIFLPFDSRIPSSGVRMIAVKRSYESMPTVPTLLFRDKSQMEEFLGDFHRHLQPPAIVKALRTWENGEVSSIKLSSVPPELARSKGLLPSPIIT